MSVSLSIIIKNDFRMRHDRDATLKKLEETAAILNEAEGIDSYFVDTDDTFDQWCIRDSDDGHFFMELWLFNGFWHMETSFGDHQYYVKTMGIRKTVYDYVSSLGQTEAWPCSEFYTWNSGILENHLRTFKDWEEFCVKRMGHEIMDLKLNEILERKEYFYHSDGVCHDTFEDYHKKMRVYNDLYSDFSLLEMNKVGPMLYLQKDSKKYLLNTDKLEFITGGPVDAYDMLDTCQYAWVKKNKETAIVSPKGELVSNFMKAHFYSQGDYDKDRNYHEYIRTLEGTFELEI